MQLQCSQCGNWYDIEDPSPVHFGSCPRLKESECHDAMAQEESTPPQSKRDAIAEKE